MLIFAEVICRSQQDDLFIFGVLAKSLLHIVPKKYA